jgi:hypothetical protein
MPSVNLQPIWTSLATLLGEGFNTIYPMFCDISGSHSGMKMTAFWYRPIAPCSLVKVYRSFIKIIYRPEDGSSTHLWNVSLLKRDYTALCPIKLLSLYPRVFQPFPDLGYIHPLLPTRGPQHYRLNEGILLKRHFNLLKIIKLVLLLHVLGYSTIFISKIDN